MWKSVVVVYYTFGCQVGTTRVLIWYQAGISLIDSLLTALPGLEPLPRII